MTTIPPPLIKDRPVIMPMNLVLLRVTILSLLITAVAGCFIIMFTPHFSFGLVEKLVCPRGSEIRFEWGNWVEDVDSEGNSTQSRQFTINCYAADGTMYKRTALALAAALASFFLAVFFPLLVITLVRRGVRQKRILRERAKDTMRQQPPPIA